MKEQRLLSTYDVHDYEVITEVSDKPTGPVKKIMMKGILQKADTLNQNGRIYPKYVLEREVRNYQKFILENRALGELDHPDSCVPTGTEIFTKNGWKKIEEISEDEIVATINIKSEEIQFQRITGLINQPYEGEMIHFSNARTYDITVTPNHRVLTWDRTGQPKFLLASELYDLAMKNDSSLSHSGLKRAGRWIGEEPEKIEIAGKLVDSSLWAAFLGIYIAEGHCSGTYAKERKKLNSVVITQNKGETCDAIRDLVSRLPWTFQEKGEGTRSDFIASDEALHSHLYDLGGSREKHVPNYVNSWGTGLLTVLLEWMMLGDGRHRQGYKQECLVPEYCTTSKQLTDDVCGIMLKLGYGATVHTTQPVDRKAPDYNETGRMILESNSAPMNIIYQHASKGISLDLRFMKIEKKSYSGRIHCVVTPNQTWLMRQNGKVCWTGNSVVNLKNVSHIVREAYMEDGTVYGTVEILDTPSGKVLQSLVESKVKLGISSRGVGSTAKKGDYYEVQDDFQLICWDYVSEPSTPGAFMIPEGKKITQAELNKVFNRSDRIDRILNEILKKLCQLGL